MVVHPTNGENPVSFLLYASASNPEYLFLFLTHPAWPCSASSSLKAESSHEQERTFVSTREGCPYQLVFLHAAPGNWWGNIS